MTDLKRIKIRTTSKILGITDIVLSIVYMAISLSGVIILAVANKGSITDAFFCFANAYNVGLIIFSFIPIVPIVFSLSLVLAIIAKSWSGVIKSLVFLNISTVMLTAYFVCLFFFGNY